jgi:CRISPR-associated protein Cmr4
MPARLTFVHALSPLHAGTGQGASVIDLPIAREKATGLPFLPGSSLKGTLRGLCGDTDDCKFVFGPDTDNISPESNSASPAQFSDQRLLLLPIRSLAGTFAWVTSPYVLHRFLRDVKEASATQPALSVPSISSEEHCHIANDNDDIKSKIVLDTNPRRVYLEDLDLEPEPSQATREWAIWIGERVFSNSPDWQRMLIERICIVHDNVFNFLIDTATEITARIKLQSESKTVQRGGLWYEEALPTETILSGLLLTITSKASDVERIFRVIDTIAGNTLQLGGKATVGRGICQLQLAKEGA